MRLFGFSPTRATRVTWTMAELDLDYTAVDEDTFNHPELRSFHPLGRIPAMEIEGKSLFESAAICNFLADSNPDSRLISPSGTWERALHDQWTFFALTEMESWAWSTFRSTNIVPEDQRVPEMYDYNRRAYQASAQALDATLSNSDYLINNSFSVADVIVGWTCHFGKKMGYHDDFPHIEAYLDRLMTRPNCTLPKFD